MAKKEFTFSIDEQIASKATEIFEQLGMTLDSAVNIFISQAVLRRGLPFQIVIPENTGVAESKEIEAEKTELQLPNDEIKHEEAETKTVTESESLPASADGAAESPKGGEQQKTEQVSLVTPEIAARVAANEALVEEMRGSLESSDCTPEFEENEEAELAKKQEAMPENIAESQPEEVTEKESEAAAIAEDKPQDISVQEESADQDENADEDEEEDQNLPDNIFDCWDLDKNDGKSR